MQNVLRNAPDLRAALSPTPAMGPAEKRLLAILLAEYGYWRDQEFDGDMNNPTDCMTEGMHMGAMASVANVIGALTGHPAPWHPQGDHQQQQHHEPEEREL